MFKKLLLIITFIGSGNLLPVISPKGTKSQITFGPNSQLQTNTSMSGLSNSVLFPANSNFQLNNNNSSASLGGISSTAITFGLDNIIELTGDATIGQSDQTWVFPYNATIDGKGHTLTILAPQGITASASATVTITNAKIICGARQAIACTSDTATVLLDKTTLILGSEGLFWGQGNLTIGQCVQVEGKDTSFFAVPSNSEFLNQISTLGFAVTSKHENSALYSMDFCGPSDDRAGISMVTLDKTGAAYYSDDNSVTTRTWHQVTTAANPYVYVSVGSDGTIWLADNAGNIYVYRVHKDSTPALVQAQNVTGNVVVVGNRFNVFVLNTTTGNVYKSSDSDRGFLNNPLTGAPQTWIQVPGIKASSIAAGNDGSLWYINASGQVILRDPYNNETLVHDGSGHTFVKISAKGSATNNSVALTCLVTSRAYISQNNGAFKDIGLANVVEAATDIDGNLMMIFDNSILAEDPTYGAPVYYRHSFAEHPVLAMDRTLNFAASVGANLTIASGGTLAMGEETTLRMSTDSQALETAYNARRHLVFEDNSSTLLLDRANIEAVCAGVSLTSGTVIVNGVCGLFPSSLPGCQTEISSDVRLKIHSSSNLQTYGRVDYCSPTRLYSTPAAAVLVDPANPQNLEVMASTLLSRGFARTTGLEPFNPGAVVAYNPTVGKIKVFSSYAPNNLSGGYNYFLSEIDPASNIPTMSNFQARGSAPAVGASDLGEDNSILYTYQPIPGVYVYLNGDNNSPQGIIGGSFPTNCSFNVSIANSTNYGVATINYNTGLAGTLSWWKPSGYIGLNLNQRSFAVTIDALWYVNNIGEIWYIPASNTNTAVRYSGARGLNIITMCVRGPLTNYKIMACDAAGKIYSADVARPLEFENLYNTPYSGHPSFSITTTGFVAIKLYDQFYSGTGWDPFFGYMRGYAPSFWSAGDNKYSVFIGWYPTSVANVDFTNKGFAPIGGNFLFYAMNMHARRIGTQIELLAGDGQWRMGQLILNQDLTVASGNSNYPFGFLAGGVDGSYVSSYISGGNIGLRYVDPSGNASVILSINYLAYYNPSNGYPADFTNAGFLVGMNDGNSVYALMNRIGKLQKWVGGTTWVDVYTDESGMPTSIAPSSDGGFWYTNRYGKLNYRDQNGVLTPVKGSQGNKWKFVTATGSSTQYKLMAIRTDGMLYSADQSRGLESEGVYSIEEATVISDGFYIARGSYPTGLAFGGWMKGMAPKWWTKLYPITG